jgi:H+/Cl- antiporter ClcA
VFFGHYFVSIYCFFQAYCMPHCCQYLQFIHSDNTSEDIELSSFLLCIFSAIFISVYGTLNAVTFQDCLILIFTTKRISNLIRELIMIKCKV